jgi:PAS domain-containing protein
MADSAPVLVWVSGIDQLRNFFNKPWLDFTGRPIDQELGSGWASGVHPDDLDRCLATYSCSFDARSAFQMEYRLRRFEGYIAGFWTIALRFIGRASSPDLSAPALM